MRTTRRRDQGTVNPATRRLVDALRPADVEPAAWDWAEVDEVLWLSALGALWAAASSLAGWRLLRERPGRLAVARAFRNVGHLAMSLQEGDAG